MVTLLILVFAVSTILAATTGFVAKGKSNIPSSKGSRLETVAYQETFENGENGWSHVDGNLAPNSWHVYNYGGTQGNVFWMGDPALASGTNPGGYHSHQYLVLDTPSIAVPATNASLTFKLRYNVESPSGATSPYTGWDACNVRVSTNGGTTWTVISGTPAYNITSAYSFGFEHGEGANIAGWGGASATWQTATFNMSAYAGQNVKIRFAFGSDPSYDTSNAAAMFGMMVDDISLGTFTSNGDSMEGFTASSLVVAGGDLWHIGTVADAPSPSNAMICSTASNTYNVNMLNYLYSPTITLPSSGTIKADFQIKGAFTDPNTFPNVDYWGWEVSIDGGVSWRAMSNPYADPDGSNYVYSDAPAEWASAVDSYSLDGLLDDFAGMPVKFRIYFKSDADTPDGSGVMIDNYTISNVIFLAAPTNLQANATETSVSLNWTAPLSGMVPAEITSTNSAWVSYINDSQPYAMKITNPFDYATVLQNIQFSLYNSGTVTGTASVYVYSDNAGLPGTTLLTVDNVGNIASGDWTTVDVASNNISIPANGVVYIGVGNFDTGTTSAGQGLLADSTSTTVNSYTFNSGTWTILDQAYTGLKNVALKATVLEQDENAPQVTSYKVYRAANATDEYAVIGEITNPETVTYSDTTPVAGVTNYYKVSAMYGANESALSNSANAFVLGAGYLEYANDDNSSDQAFNVGNNKQFATKFIPTRNSTLKFVKIFVNTPGTNPIMMRVYDDDGVTGLPGTQLLQTTYAAANIVAGWNTIPITTELSFPSGNFYVAVLEANNSSVYGLDTANMGKSYKKTSSTNPWEQIPNGNVMIRAIVRDDGVGIDEEIAPSGIMALDNYPNPFNPTTTIRYNLPKDSNVTVKIFNTKGQLVKTLVNEAKKAGNNSIAWNGLDNNNNPVASGVYLYRLEAGKQIITKKMVMQK